MIVSPAVWLACSSVIRARPLSPAPPEWVYAWALAAAKRPERAVRRAVPVAARPSPRPTARVALAAVVRGGWRKSAGRPPSGTSGVSGAGHVARNRAHDGQRWRGGRRSVPLQHPALSRWPVVRPTPASPRQAAVRPPERRRPRRRCGPSAWLPSGRDDRAGRGTGGHRVRRPAVARERGSPSCSGSSGSSCRSCSSCSTGPSCSPATRPRSSRSRRAASSASCSSCGTARTTHRDNGPPAVAAGRRSGRRRSSRRVVVLGALVWLRPFGATPEAVAAMSGSADVRVTDAPAHIVIEPTSGTPPAA